MPKKLIVDASRCPQETMTKPKPGAEPTVGLSYMTAPEMFTEEWVLVKLTRIYEYEEDCRAAVQAQKEKDAELCLDYALRIEAQGVNGRMSGNLLRELAAAIRSQE